MTFRTIETDMASVGAATETDTATLGVTRRTRSARRAAILGRRFRGARAWHYSNY